MSRGTDIAGRLFAEACDLVMELRRRKALSGDEETDLEAVMRILTVRREAAVFKESSDKHLTVSAVILDDSGQNVLLNHHRKHARWKHFGGHLEHSDASIIDAICREIFEETGLGDDDFVLSPRRPSERPGARLVDVRPISGPAGDHVDLDLRFAFVAKRGAREKVSSESIDLRWVGIIDAPALIGPDDPCAVIRLIRLSQEAWAEHQRA
jgi:8-oxo-dGTP pyrophosphatase MutT (NUDIX family)